MCIPSPGTRPAASSVSRWPSRSTEACGDNRDNDCDGLVDEPSPPTPPRWLVTGSAFTGQALFWNVSAAGALPPGPTRDGPTPASGELIPRVVADLDGDGIAEVLLEQVDPLDDDVDEVFLWGLGCSGAPALRAGSGLELPGDHRIASLGDLDGDGDADLLTVDGSGALRTLLNDGAAAFSAFDAAGSVAAGANLPTTLLDFDGDGRVDLLACVASTGTSCVLHPGLGDGTFGPGGLLLLVSEALSGPAWADLDGDGDVDLALTGAVGGDAGSLWIFLGDGAGSLEPGLEAADVLPSVEAGGGAARLAFTELDGGDPDVVLLLAPVPGGRARQLHSLLGDGAGGFVPDSSANFSTATDFVDQAGGLAASPPAP